MILTCDGGGIRGLIIARCLEKLEAIEGKPCHQIFDFMSGTSTGAIIVGALAVGIPAKQIVQLYLAKGKDIFKKTSNPWNRFFKWTYTKDETIKIFQEIYKDTVLKELPVDIMITVKDTVRNETMFFEKKTFGNMLLKEAVESSMSAPTYFPPNGRYVDGGVGTFNNTCYQAAIEAIHYLKYPAGQIRILSFGTGREISKLKKGEAKKRYKLFWAGYVIGDGMDDANEQQVDFVRREYVSTKEVEFRRYQLSFEEKVFTTLGVPLDKVRDPRVFKMDAVQYLDTLDLVAKKFAEHIDFTKPQGVELGDKPALSEQEFSEYCRKNLESN